LMAAQAEVKSMGAEACGIVVPLLASRSASVLPSRPTCPGICWTLMRFDEPIFARTVPIFLLLLHSAMNHARNSYNHNLIIYHGTLA